MQKDFHYCLIKVLTQKSGFSEEDAQTIAYASQYTDDAVEHLPIQVKNLPDLGFKKRINGEYFDPTSLSSTLFLTWDMQRPFIFPTNLISNGNTSTMHQALNTPEIIPAFFWRLRAPSSMLYARPINNRVTGSVWSTKSKIVFLFLLIQ